MDSYDWNELQSPVDQHLQSFFPPQPQDVLLQEQGLYNHNVFAQQSHDPTNCLTIYQSLEPVEHAEPEASAPPARFQHDDSFEDVMWANYNRLASAEDRVEIPHSTQQSDDTVIDTIAHTSHYDSPLSIDTSGVFSAAEATEPSPATSVTSSLRSPALQEQIHRRFQHDKSRKSSKSSASTHSDRSKSFSSAASSVTSAPSSSHQQHATSSTPKPTSRKRERNRLSAQKCRQRSKTKLSELEDQAEGMAEEHETLLLEIKDLQYELIAAQVECMEHIRCRCPEVKSAMSRPAADVSASAAIKEESEQS